MTPLNPDVDFKNLSLDELQAMQDKLSSLVAKQLQNKKKDALQQIKELVVKYDLSYEEVVEVIRTTTRRGKAPAIYRNPANARQTWSGKGDAPSWFTEAKDKEALRIPGA